MDTLRQNGGSIEVVALSNIIDMFVMNVRWDGKGNRTFEFNFVETSCPHSNSKRKIVFAATKSQLQSIVQVLEKRFRENSIRTIVTNRLSPARKAEQERHRVQELRTILEFLREVLNKRDFPGDSN